MNELIAVLAAAALFAVFGLLARRPGGCAGPHACAASDGSRGCGACPSREQGVAVPR
jgi:hypothetical protein